MASFKCNSCGGTYSDTQADGTSYFHACAPETIEPAEFDATGKRTKEEKRTPRTDVRDENFVRGLVLVDGKPKLQTADPTKNVPSIFIDPPSLIVSEGKGRTQIG